MASFNDNLLRYTSEEENVLRARLRAIRAAIPPEHPADKGRSTEVAVYNFLRDILPNEYGLTTGYIAYHKSDSIQEQLEDIPKGHRYHYLYRPDRDEILLSSQLDLIIYDAMRFAPIARLESCDIVPFEAVMGYVEIKSWINDAKNKHGLTPLQQILSQSRKLRDINAKLYWLSEPGKYTKTVLMPYPLVETIAVRSFVFVLEADASIGGFEGIRSRLENSESRQLGGFLTSMYVQDCGYFKSHHAEDASDPKIGTFECIQQSALANFKIALLSSLARFPRADRSWTLAVDRYYSNSPVRSAEVILTKEEGQVPKMDLVITEP